MRKPRDTLLVRHLPPTTKAGGGAAAQHRVGRLSSQACKHGFAARHAPNKESLSQSLMNAGPSFVTSSSRA
jgi:hypothetical protein